MTTIRVIGLLDATGEGPTADGPDGQAQVVHLRQGSLDGACGPYALCMALLMCGALSRDAACSVGVIRDGRTTIGKLFARMNEHHTLFKHGTDLDDLQDILAGLFKKVIHVEEFDGDGAACRKFVRDHVTLGHPVLLGLHWPGGGHWVVVVGLEFEENEGNKPVLCRFLVLDPDADSPKVSAWNGVIDARGSGGQYPYTGWTLDGIKVRLSTAMAIWPKAVT